MGHRGQSDLLYYAHAASHSRKTVVGTCGQGPLLNHRRLVLHQPNPAACGFWYLDAAAAFLRISGKLSKTKQNKQTNKPSNKTKKQKKKNRRKKLQQLQERAAGADAAVVYCSSSPELLVVAQRLISSVIFDTRNIPFSPQDILES
jgi:hypothetical protein